MIERLNDDWRLGLGLDPGKNIAFHWLLDLQ